MVHISYIEHIIINQDKEVEFFYDCTVDFENENYPVTARLTGSAVYEDGKLIGKWADFDGLWPKEIKGHDWDGFDQRVIERASYQHEFNKAA